MPVPLSWTETRRNPGFGSADTTTRPPSRRCRSAFAIRLVSTWMTRSRSPSTGGVLRATRWRTLMRRSRKRGANPATAWVTASWMANGCRVIASRVSSKREKSSSSSMKDRRRLPELRAICRHWRCRSEMGPSFSPISRSV